MYVKVVELVGESQSSWRNAVENAVRQASQELPNVTGVEVYNLTANVENGKVSEFKANVKVACVSDTPDF